MSDTLKIIRIKKFEHANELLPYYATKYSSGMDLFAANTDIVILKPGEFKMIPTGIAIALPNMYEAQIRPRSGLAANYGVTVLNSPGTIDSDYRGEIKVILINHGQNDFVVERGTRIAQMVICNYIRIQSWDEVNELEESTRGTNGFGSTGFH